jgi:hypothetical protein
MRIRLPKRRSARTKPYADAGRVEFEFAFARLSARIYLYVVRDMESYLEEAGMTPRMPPDGAALVARAHVFLANDTTEQAWADLELIDSLGRYYLRRRTQKQNAVRKSALRRFGRKPTSKRRNVRTRAKVKGLLRGVNRK